MYISMARLKLFLGIKKLDLNRTYLTEPEGAKWDSNKQTIVDKWGNVIKNQLVRFCRDVKAPTLTNNSITTTPGGITRNSIEISWYAGTDDFTSHGNLRYQLGWSAQHWPDDGVELSGKGDGWITYKVTNLMPNALYTFTLCVYDESGNTSYYKSNSWRTLPPPDDNTPPELPDDPRPSFSNITETSAKISWAKATDNETPQDFLDYQVWWKRKYLPGIGGGVVNPIWNKSGWMTDASSFTLTGLLRGTEYVVEIVVKDLEANSSYYSTEVQGNTSFTTLASDFRVGSKGYADHSDLTITPADNPSLTSGQIVYSASTKTLTLSNATISGGNSDAFSSKIDGLTVHVIGTNTLKSNNSAFYSKKACTIAGTGTLNATGGGSCGIYADGAQLTIDGCTVNAKGTWGFAGSVGGNHHESLTICDATVTAEGSQGSICDFATFTLDGCAITQPVGAAFNASLKGVAVNGKIVKTKVVITPTPTGIASPEVSDDASIVPARKRGVYNLQGVRLGTSPDKLPKGVYIINGKKVVKK